MPPCIVDQHDMVALIFTEYSGQLGAYGIMAAVRRDPAGVMRIEPEERRSGQVLDDLAHQDRTVAAQAFDLVDGGKPGAGCLVQMLR